MTQPEGRVAGAVYVRLVLASLFWGGTFIAGRHLALSMPHFVAATGRFLVACALLLAYVQYSEGGLPRLDRRQMLATFALGASGVFAYNAFFFAGLERVAASRGSLIIALNPIVTALAARLLLRERWNGMRTAGVAISIVGAYFVIVAGTGAKGLSGAVGAGEVLMFCAVLSWVAYTLLARLALQGLSPLAATTWSTLWGTLLLAAPALWQLASAPAAWPDAASWLAMVYMGALGTAVAFVWYYDALSRIGAARSAVFANFVPVFGVLLSVLLLGEPLHGATVAGGALVIAGVTLANRATRSR